MKNQSLIYTYILACLLFVTACSKEKHNETKEEEHKDEIPHTKNEVVLTSEQLKVMNIQLGTLEDKNLSSSVKANGYIELPPQNKASISSLIAGMITKIYVIQGDHVNSGQVLATLESPEIIRLQKDYLDAKSKLAYSQKEFERQKELYEEKIVAGKKFQLAEANYYSDNALVKSLEGQLQQLGIAPRSIANGNMTRSVSIKSPIEGYVHKIEVNTGSYIEPAREVFMVVDNRHVHIDLRIYEKDVPKVKTGQKVIFTVSNQPEKEFIANIFSVGKAFENESKTVSIHADIKGNINKNLLPGTYVEGRVIIDSASTPALPDDALFTEGDISYIFVKESERKEKDEKSGKETSEMKFKKVQVQTGLSDMGYTEIKPINPLPPNTVIVTKGTYYLASILKQKEGGDEH